MNKDAKDVNNKKMCHTTCTRAYAEEERVRKAKKVLKKTTVTDEDALRRGDWRKGHESGARHGQNRLEGISEI